ncbi:O-methyltransferase [Actinoalloteichus caeruleus]|uniref:Caffeoyl-CoA O-methyltransferase n=2 Tax=Actinoalloteichus cyanogriseus TaxID=2893586 RepID=A0ABT1JE83_ACTCY|nr:class I SAM-dependent methyltransferase [Actinoalloteichus caeruleus]MCP2330804.1 caffeoyl-CoA O-methyltransferase [Actinoalloteichus caeruleus DSM 43889]
MRHGNDPKHFLVDRATGDYLARSSTTPVPALRSLAARTAALGEAAGMAVPLEQAALLTLLARTLSARNVVDLGTFTGLSALSLALGVAEGGQVTTCDVSDRWVGLAREHWRLAGVADRVLFRRSSGARVLRELAQGPPVDLVFVDADKMNYPAYCRAAVPLLRPGGLLVVDNVLMEGWAVAPERAEPGLPRRCAEAVRSANASLAEDDRLETVMLPVADGLTIARRR